MRGRWLLLPGLLSGIVAADESLLAAAAAHPSALEQGVGNGCERRPAAAHQQPPVSLPTTTWMAWSVKNKQPVAAGCATTGCASVFVTAPPAAALWLLKAARSAMPAPAP